ncbi:MAG: MFS transporter [Paludibacteraceae bacterium]|nr:MFS transporter [Paludibacteraceae bacterium]
MKNKSLQIRLIVMNFLEFAVWGAYLTSMGRYLGAHGMGGNIGWFYSIQGIVSLFMPALMGIVADRWMQAQKVQSLCHFLAGAFMCAAGAYAFNAGANVPFAPLFTLYTLSVAFYMPTIALTNSVAFNALVKAGMDTVKDFPPIRVFGTVGFIATMWVVDILGAMDTPAQFVISGGLSLILAVYSLTLPKCEIKKTEGKVDMVEALGLKAFTLFKQKKMALFFIFSMLLGMCLQVTNGYANPFLGSFEYFQDWTNTFGVQHSGILISISQICEALCILAIPFFLKRFGIKNVMFIAMLAWVFRFGFFGAGNPGMPGVLLFVLSCIVYGFAFDFFNISGALYVDQETAPAQRSSAQGLFMMMTNGLGATIGTLSAQVIVNKTVPMIDKSTELANYGIVRDANDKIDWAATELNGKLPEIHEAATNMWNGWQEAWYIFAGFALLVAVSFWIFFPKTPVNKNMEIKH